MFISCNYSCTFFFLVKILLVKLKNLHTSVCLKLNYCSTNRIQKRKSCKNGGNYQTLWPIPLLFLVIFSAPQSSLFLFLLRKEYLWSRYLCILWVYYRHYHLILFTELFSLCHTSHKVFLLEIYIYIYIYTHCMLYVCVYIYIYIWNKNTQNFKFPVTPRFTLKSSMLWFAYRFRNF